MGKGRSLRENSGTHDIPWERSGGCVEVTGNPDLTGVHFWSASQAWETRGPAPRLAPRLPGEVKGPNQFQSGGSGTKPSTSDLKTVGTISSLSCCKVSPGTSWSFLWPSPIPHPPSFSTSPGALGWESRSLSVFPPSDRRQIGFCFS